MERVGEIEKGEICQLREVADAPLRERDFRERERRETAGVKLGQFNWNVVTQAGDGQVFHVIVDMHERLVESRIVVASTTHAAQVGGKGGLVESKLDFLGQHRFRSEVMESRAMCITSHPSIVRQPYDEIVHWGVA